MTHEEQAHIQVPLTDFVRGVASEAATEAAMRVLKEYRLNCPTMPKVIELHDRLDDLIEGRKTLTAKIWDVSKIVLAACVSWFLAKHS